MEGKGYFWQGLGESINRLYGFNQNERMATQAQESKKGIETEKSALAAKRFKLEEDRLAINKAHQDEMDNKAMKDPVVAQLAAAHKEAMEKMSKLDLTPDWQMDQAAKEAAKQDIQSTLDTLNAQYKAKTGVVLQAPKPVATQAKPGGMAALLNKLN